MTYPRIVTAQLLDYDGTVVSGTPLATAFGISFYDEEDGPGHGKCSLSLSEAGSAELRPGRYVDCLVAGTSRFTFKIEGNPQYSIIEQGEEHDQIITVQGRGWGANFDEVTTYPAFGQKFVIETSWRLFSFASPDFPNDSGWLPAVENHEYLDGVVTSECWSHAELAPDGNLYPSPIGFPWPTNPFNLVGGVPTANYEESYWIRPSATLMPNYADTGYYFFRTTFTLAETTAVTFTVTGDNFFTLFLEGVPILGEAITNGDHFMWKGWKEHKMWLPSGTFQVAAAVYNISFADLGDGTPVYQPPCPSEGWAGGARYDNPGGLLCVLYEDQNQTVAPVFILASDDAWDSWYNETTWPGWTPGQIIQKLIDEAVARGGLTVYNSNTFDAALDSNSDVWRPYDTSISVPDIPTFAMEVGSTLMAALDQLVKLGYIHWHVQPGTMVLDVYRGREPSSPTPATTFDTTNLVAYERNATELYANALQVQWEGGYVVVEDAAAITAYGTRVEDVYTSDTPSEAEAEAEGRTELARRAHGAYPAIVAGVEPVDASDCPYEGFETGDYITVPLVGGGTEDVRCLSINCVQDGEGYAVWTTELNAKLEVPERQREELLRQIGGRSKAIRGTVT